MLMNIVITTVAVRYNSLVVSVIVNTITTYYYCYYYSTLLVVPATTTMAVQYNRPAVVNTITTGTLLLNTIASLSLHIFSG